MNDKPVVILATGPLHLFWTTGVYYLWELRKNYRTVLVVSDEYREDDLFSRVAHRCGVQEVLYLPGSLQPIRKHRHYARSFEVLSRKYPDAFLLQYNNVYPDNLYLSHFITRQSPDNRAVTFQNGQLFTDYDADYRARVAFSVDRESRRYAIPGWLAKLVHVFKGEVHQVLDFHLMPLLTVGFPFKPPLKLHTGKINRENLRETRDIRLYYKAIEKLAAERIEGFSEYTKRFLIRHPLETVGEECNNFLFCVSEESLAVILPSYGFVNVLTGRKNADEMDVIEALSKRWLDVIGAIKSEYPEWNVAWKLHPAALNDRASIVMTNRIREQFPDVLVVPPAEKASNWILRSRLIVSDVSTVLWWASFIRGKIVCSMDIFGYRGGDSMKEYEGIEYLSSVAQLRDLLALREGRASIAGQSVAQELRPSLTEFLEGVRCEEGIRS